MTFKLCHAIPFETQIRLSVLIWILNGQFFANDPSVMLKQAEQQFPKAKLEQLMCVIGTDSGKWEIEGAAKFAFKSE